MLKQQPSDRILHLASDSDNTRLLLFRKAAREMCTAQRQRRRHALQLSLSRRALLDVNLQVSGAALSEWARQVKAFEAHRGTLGQGEGELDVKGLQDLPTSPSSSTSTPHRRQTDWSPPTRDAFKRVVSHARKYVDALAALNGGKETVGALEIRRLLWRHTLGPAAYWSQHTQRYLEGIATPVHERVRADIVAPEGKVGPTSETAEASTDKTVAAAKVTLVLVSPLADLLCQQASRGPVGLGCETQGSNSTPSTHASTTSRASTFSSSELRARDRASIGQDGHGQGQAPESLAPQPANPPNPLGGLVEALMSVVETALDLILAWDIYAENTPGIIGSRRSSSSCENSFERDRAIVQDITTLALNALYDLVIPSQRLLIVGMVASRKLATTLVLSTELTAAVEAFLAGEPLGQ